MCEKCKAAIEQQSKSDFGPEMVSINENNVQLIHHQEEQRQKGLQELEVAVNLLHEAAIDIVLRYVKNRNLGAHAIEIKPELQYLSEGVINHMKLGIAVTMLTKDGVGIKDEILVIPVDTNVADIADEIVRQFTLRAIENEVETRKENNTTVGGN